ncbi:cytosine permease [Acidiphilium acidophilum]|uniref:cytosine permease n=1 Tax=Acidiphilium acidophilum TaxID=76588 RepID=UPI002E8E70E0|nr:cytosine permease [Acidiphilium acidophilum]
MTDPALTNADLAPTTAAQRTWRWYHFVALWIGMVMCIPAYTLASSMIGVGMSWGEAVFTVFLGNLIVLIPMLLIGHAGARFGIPYAVLARASFGTTGARLPAMMRALVACGWYGIQTWFGGEMIYTLIGVLRGHPIGGAIIPGIGINAAQLVCFLAFWAMELWYVIHGMDAIRKLETYTAPAKIVICAVLLGWIYHRVGGFGPLLDKPSAFAAGGRRPGSSGRVSGPR